MKIVIEELGCRSGRRPRWKVKSKTLSALDPNNTKVEEARQEVIYPGEFYLNNSVKTEYHLKRWVKAFAVEHGIDVNYAYVAHRGFEVDKDGLGRRIHWILVSIVFSDLKLEWGME